MSIDDSSPRHENELGDPDDRTLFLSRAIRFLDGDLDAGEIEAFNAQLNGSQEKLKALAELQVSGAMIRHSLRQTAYDAPESPRQSIHIGDQRSFQRLTVAVAASMLLMVAAYYVGRTQSLAEFTRWDQEPGHQEPSTMSDSSGGTIETESSLVKLTNSSRARFFGELVPSAQLSLVRNHEYVLTAGLVELSFPAGASAIIESPAVFRVLANDSLAMDAGNCSVHAPEGAQGFRVETPTTRVVDRGTRFMVSVGENADTEVQVIEGAADVYAETTGEAAIRLTDQDARRFPGRMDAAMTDVPFAPKRYQANLPDRIVRYHAATVASGKVNELQSVTVQRGGRMQTVSVNDLIGVKLTSFRSGAETNPNGHFAAGSKLGNRLALLSDGRLNTGIINPGGSRKPLLTQPDSQTPGFGVQFDSPVVNEPGPDVVFFELQCMTNPVGGDAFHVSPLRFSENHKSHTVGSYDLSLASPDVHPIAGFTLYRFSGPLDSLDQLVSAECFGSPVRLGFRAIVVGIDLTDMGFEQGETVTELFFQDAADDSSIVDPVFIGGLPAL